MTYKTVLVYCDAGETTPKCLAVATDIAQRFDARLVALHARAPFEMPTSYEDSFSIGPLIEEHEERVKTDQAASRGFFDKAMKGKAMTSEWREIDGRPGDVLAMSARYADLVVVGQTSPDNPFTTPENLPEAVAMASGRPTLVVPHIGTAKSVGKKVMLCWNASRESARAAADAMPFLKAAAKVIVLVVELKDKIKTSGLGAARSSSQPPPGDPDQALLSALVNLGYRPAAAERTAEAVRRSLGPGAPLEAQLREALRIIAGTP